MKGEIFSLFCKYCHNFLFLIIPICLSAAEMRKLLCRESTVEIISFQNDKQ